MARIDAKKAELVEGVMGGRGAHDLLQFGMLLGRHQGLAEAKDIILGKREEDAASRGDRT